MFKALQTRDLELKGVDKAAFTIPIIYRKTFNWVQPGVKFIPINHRSFVIFKGDLDSEEFMREKYTKVKINIDKIPRYIEDRLSDKDISVRVELKEALLAASLKDRYVQVTINKPNSKELYEILKHDMEELDSELGFEYSTDHQGIHCSFKFPKHDLKYYALEGRTCVEKAIETLEYYTKLINQDKFAGARKGINDIWYNIHRLELLMDRYFSDALNIVWDLPNITCPGYFLWINSCERILDEFQYLTQETKNALSNLKTNDIKLVGESSDIFEFVWTKAIYKSLEFCKKGISTICLAPDETCIFDAFNLIHDYEEKFVSD